MPTCPFSGTGAPLWPVRRLQHHALRVWPPPPRLEQIIVQLQRLPAKPLHVCEMPSLPATRTLPDGLPSHWTPSSRQLPPRDLACVALNWIDCNDFSANAWCGSPGEKASESGWVGATYTKYVRCLTMDSYGSTSAVGQCSIVKL
jgi:hypothetical protein